MRPRVSILAVDVLFDRRQPSAEIVARGRQACRGRAFQVLLNCDRSQWAVALHRAMACAPGRAQAVRAPAAGSPRGPSRQRAFASVPRSWRRAAAAVGGGAGRPFPRRPRPCSADGAASASGGEILSRRATRASCRVSISESSRTLSSGCSDFTSTPQSATSWLDAAQKHFPFAAALRQLFVQQRRPRLHVLNSHRQPRRLADLPRLELRRQAGPFQPFAPRPPRVAKLFVGRVGPFGRLVGVLPRGGVPRIQRRQFLQVGKLLFGRRQAGDHRPAAPRKLVVQHRPLVLALLDLRFQQPQLVLRLFKLLVVRSYRCVAGKYRSHKEHQADGGNAPIHRTAPR